MASKSVVPETTVIDPRFDIPEGLTEFVYPDASVPADGSTLVGADSDVVNIFTGEPNADELLSDDYTHDAPAIPQQFAILSQIIHMSPDGRQLVDVEIEVEDIPGVIQIDFRVTKT